MSDALTRGAERLAGVAAAYVGHVGPVDENTIVTVDPDAFVLDIGVKALVEYVQDREACSKCAGGDCHCLGCEAANVLNLWETGLSDKETA